MALLKPFTYSAPSQGWGPSKRADEPEGWAMLGRFWYNKPVVPGFVRVYNFHPALDLPAAEGTPIKASEAGTVAAVGPNPLSPASGIRIRIRIRPGTFYGHGHCQRIAINPATGKAFAVGDHVARGQVIAYVGHTGSATGNHSHFYVEAVVPGTSQHMLYNPNLFFPYGANANDPRIKPL